MKRRKFLALLGATALTPLVPPLDLIPLDLNEASFEAMINQIAARGTPLLLRPKFVVVAQQTYDFIQAELAVEPDDNLAEGEFYWEYVRETA